MNWLAHFDALGDHVAASCPGDRGFTLWLNAEASDFVRFNHGLVRQPGSVTQAAVDLRWIAGRRHAQTSVTLTGDLTVDRGRVDAARAELEAIVPSLPEDPHFQLATDVQSTEHDDGGRHPDAVAITEAIVDTAQSGTPDDLVGIYAGGVIQRAFRNHLGQRNTFTTHGCIFDWSLVHGADKAVKCTWAGDAWDQAAFEAEMAQARGDLRALERPSRKLEPGSWRAYLTPAAVSEILELLAWDGFGARAQHKKQSCLAKLVAGEASLNPMVSIAEDTARGLAPDFSPMGFVRPPVVPLVSEGRHAGALVSPRTAVELGVPTNGASSAESPASLSMAGGSLPTAEARRALGTGVWVSNLWYLNHSDRNAARFTGMTRFATLWIEDGEVVGPVDVMRFDDSLYELFGDRLEALTAETAFLPSTSTYGWRSTSSIRVPGALVKGITFTL